MKWIEEEKEEPPSTTATTERESREREREEKLIRENISLENWSIKYRFYLLFERTKKTRLT